jgi:hypothetical protein
MKSYTEEEWIKFGEMYDALATFAFSYVAEKTGNPRGYTINHVDFESHRLQIEYDDSCFGCASRDWEYCPIEYLWTDGWREKLHEELAEKKRLEDEEKVAKEARIEREAEAKEREEYERLRKKFE